MNEEIIFQLGSMVGRAILIAMGLVALVTGWIMVFDAYGLYRNRETRVGQSRQDTKTSPVAEPTQQTPEPARSTRTSYAYRQAEKGRV